MKSKKFISLLSVSLIMGMLTSCGGNNNSSSNTTKDDKPTSVTSVPTSEASDTTGDSENYFIKEKTTIYMWATLNDTYGKRVLNFVDAFQKVEPNVTVEYVKQTGSYNDLKDKIIDGFASDNYPDLAQCYPDHVAEYLDLGRAYDLTPYMYNKDYGWTADDIDDIITAYLDEGASYTLDGYYSLPFSKSTEAMYYNEDILLNTTHAQGIVNAGKDLGITINDGNPINADYLNNLTWDELFDNLCPAIVKYNDSLPEKDSIIDKTGKDWSVVGYDSDDNLFITLAEQYGYPYTSVDTTVGVGSADFDTKEMRDLVTYFNSAARNHYLLSKGSYGDYVNNLFTARGLLFSIGSTGGYTYQFSADNPMNVGVARIPQAKAEDGMRKVINQGPSIAFLNHPAAGDKAAANRRLASWLFYKFMENEANSLDWTLETGYNGIRLSNYESDEYKAQTDLSSTDPKTLERLKAKNMNYVGTVTDDLFASPVFIGSSGCRNAVGALMTKALNRANDATEVATNNKTNVENWFADALNEAKKGIKA